MALQIWLPLNGDLKNQGINDVTVTNHNAVIDNNGKIGKCYRFETNSNYITLNKKCCDLFNDGDSFSYCFWIKISSYYSGNSSGSGSGGTVLYQSEQTIVNGTTVKGGGFGVLINQSGSAIAYANPFQSGKGVDIGTIPLNIWTHVCMTYDKATMKLTTYLNGNYVSSSICSSDWGSNGKNFIFGVGSQGGWNNSSDNYQNDIRIYDHCLSEDEIHELYLCKVIHYLLNEDTIEPTVNLGGVASNYSTVNEGVAYGASAWGGDAGTITYYKHGGYNDGPYKVYHKTATGSGGIRKKLADDIVIEAGKTYTMSVYVKSNRDFTDSSYSFNINRGSDNNYITADVNVHFTTNWTRITKTFTATSAQAGNYGEMSIIYNDAVADYYVYFSCFQIEEKDHATPYVDGTRVGYCPDISGNHYDLITTGNPTLSNDSARYNKSTLFNGSNYLSCTSPTAEAKTLSLWAYVGSIPTSSSVLFADYKSKLSLGFYNYGTLLITRCGGTSETLGTISSLVKTNAWNHFCVVNGSTNQLYINGLAAAMSGSKNWGHSTDTLMIGMRSAGSGFANKISDVRLYATALSADDVQYLYSLGN